MQVRPQELSKCFDALLVVDVQDPPDREIRAEGENVEFESEADRPVGIHP